MYLLHELTLETPEQLDFENYQRETIEALYELIMSATIECNHIDPANAHIVVIRWPIQ